MLGTLKPPLSLAWLASVLRARGHVVQVADLTAARESAPALARRLSHDGVRPWLVVFPSTFPTWDADLAAMAGLATTWGAHAVAFGPHASAAPAAALERAIAAGHRVTLISGEPEDAVAAIASRGPASTPADWAAIDGVAWIEETSGGHPRPVIATRPARFEGFTAAAAPDWSGLPLPAYRLPLVNAPYLLVETSRGCPYTCEFCVAPIQQGHAFRERPAAALVDEIAGHVADRGIRHVYLWGDTVTLNIKSFGGIADALTARRLGVRWIANARADNLTDPQFVSRLAASGCWMLSFGIEADLEDRRNAMQKRLADAPVRAAIANLRAAGIRSFGFFILGYPGETRASMTRAIDHAASLGLDFAGFYPAVPYPGTGLGIRAAAEGWLSAPDEWPALEYSRYAMRPPGLDEPLVLSMIARARRRFYLRPGYLAHHALDLARLAASAPGITWRVARQMLARSRAN